MRARSSVLVALQRSPQKACSLRAGALEACGRSLEEAQSMCLCMSGVDTPADVERLSGAVQRWVPPSASVLVTNDAVGALAGGTRGRLHGAVLIAGTGTALEQDGLGCAGLSRAVPSRCAWSGTAQA